MHGIQCDEVEFQNCSSLVNSKYILVHTVYTASHGASGTYRYRFPQHGALHLITLRPLSGAYESQQNAWLQVGPFSQFPSSWQPESPPQSDHPDVACHCQSSTAKCWPHTRASCCHACHLKLLRLWTLQLPPLVHGWASSAPLTCWKRLGWTRDHLNPLCISIYQYIKVYTSMYVYVPDCMYWHIVHTRYVLVCTCVQKRSCRARAHLGWTFSACSLLILAQVAVCTCMNKYTLLPVGIYQYIPVYTSMYQYILVHTSIL